MFASIRTRSWSISGIDSPVGRDGLFKMAIAPISSATSTPPLSQTTIVSNSGTNVTQPKPAAPPVQGTDSDGDNDGSGTVGRVNVNA